MTIAANLKRIRESLGQSPVTLVAVSKYVGIDEMIEAFKSGVTEFGESRIQDAIKKQDEMPPQVAEHIRWHFIGHLQSNKARKALGRFDLIHSIDSIELVQELSTQAAKKNLVQAILLQVKVMDDPNKSGFSPEGLKQCFEQIYKMPGIKVEGLMTMTPLADDPEIWKRCFTGLRDLKSELEKQHGISLKELSMGMSDDYIDAVKYGATIVRVGRAIFEKSEN